MRHMIFLLRIVLFMPVFHLSAQAQQPVQTEPEENVTTAENKLEEFITPPYTCIFCKTYGKTLLHDTKHILIFPTYYNRKEWLLFGAVVGGVLVLSTMDEKIQRTIQTNRNEVTDTVADIINPFGFQAANAIMAGFYLHGAFFHNPKSKVVALDAISSTLISWGVMSTLLKLGTGRARPFLKEGRYHFEPFEGGDNNAFPSGHATQAFTLAAVISSHYHRKAVVIPVYSLATLVALARMSQDKHWTSDVVGGALLGTFIGRELVVYNRRKRAELATKTELTFVPFVNDRGRGVNLFIRFN